MPNVLFCKFCGFKVDFEDEERGQEVYCGSCGKACAVPDEPVQTTAPDTAHGPSPSAAGNGETKAGARVFGVAALDALPGQVVRELPCAHCGAPMPVAIEDYGTRVHCSSCGTENVVGETLERRPVTRPKPFPSNVAADVPARRHPGRSIIAKLLVLGGSLSLVVYASRYRPEILSVPARVWGQVLSRPPSRSPGVAYHPGAVADRSTPVTKPLRSSEPSGQSEKEVTLADVEKLAQRTDLHDALIDAQLMRRLLQSQGVDPNDPRLSRLDQVIRALIEKLTPADRPDPPYIAEFRGHVDALSTALHEKRLAGGRETAERAQRLLDAHPTDLTPYARRFLSLKQTLRRLEARAHGLSKMKGLLDEAKALAERDRVGEALEREATAKFLALMVFTGLAEDEVESLDRQARELVPHLKLARGRRAVAQADEANRQADLKTRDSLIKEARELLPGLREADVKPLFAELDKLAELKVGKPRRSALADEVAFRRLQEQALEQFGRGQVDKLLTTCLEGDRVSRSWPEPVRQERHAKLGMRLLELLEARVTDLVEAGRPSSTVVEGLTQARSMLERARPWQALERWQVLDGVVRQRGSELAAQALARAGELAEADKLSEAVAVLTPEVLALAQRDVADRARALSKSWRDEIELRANREAEQKAWDHVEQLAREEKTLEAWSALTRFRRRYSRSETRPQVEEREARLKHDLDRQLRGILVATGTMLREGRYAEFRGQMTLLETVIVPKGLESDWSDLVAERKKLDESVKAQLTRAKRFAGIHSEAEVLAVLDIAADVLKLDPTNEQARALEARARQAGQAWANNHLQTAERQRENSKTASFRRGLLRRVLMLDPHGPAGRRASELLKELDAALSRSSK